MPSQQLGSSRARETFQESGHCVVRGTGLGSVARVEGAGLSGSCVAHPQITSLQPRLEATHSKGS